MSIFETKLQNSATQLFIEVEIIPVGKSDPIFDLQVEIIFAGNHKVKINKLIGISYTHNQFTLRFNPIDCQTHQEGPPFNNTKGSSYISLVTSNQ